MGSVFPWDGWDTSGGDNALRQMRRFKSRGFPLVVYGGKAEEKIQRARGFVGAEGEGDVNPSTARNTPNDCTMLYGANAILLTATWLFPRIVFYWCVLMWASKDGN